MLQIPFLLADSLNAAPCMYVCRLKRSPSLAHVNIVCAIQNSRLFLQIPNQYLPLSYAKKLTLTMGMTFAYPMPNPT